MEKESVEIITDLLQESSDFFKHNLSTVQHENKQAIQLWLVHNEHRRLMNNISADKSKND